jgi:hypothetical protein
MKIGVKWDSAYPVYYTEAGLDAFNSKMVIELTAAEFHDWEATRAAYSKWQDRFHALRKG